MPYLVFTCYWVEWSPHFSPEKGKRIPQMLSLVIQSIGVEELRGSVVPEGSGPSAPPIWSRIKDAVHQKTLHMGAGQLLVRDQDADNYRAGELLGPQCPGTSSTYHRLSLLSPPQGPGLPPVTMRRGREQPRTSPTGSQLALRPALHTGPGHTYPVQLHPAPAFTRLVEPANLGFPPSPDSLFS